MQANILFDVLGGSTFRSTSVIATAEVDNNAGGNSSITFTMTTSGYSDDTKLYWSTAGSINANTFTDNATSGFCIVKNNTAIVTRTIMNNPSSTDPTSFKLQLLDSSGGNVLTASPVAVINDIPLTSLPEDTLRYVLYEKPTAPPITPTAQTVNPAAVTANVSSINEGESVAFTVTSSGLSNGTYYWDLTSDSLLSGSRFSDSLDSGSFTLTNNTGTITRTATANFAVDGLTSFAINVRKNSVTGNIFGTSSPVLVNDIYTATPAVSANITSVNEGSSVTFTVTSTGIANGTTLYWTTTGTTNAADFTDNANSGSFTINNNTASITRTLKNDQSTEGSETVVLDVRFGSTSGTVIASSSNVVIVNDTSISWVTSGLVVHLDATSSSSYPGTGTTWYNLGSGGSTYNATLAGTGAYSLPTYTSGSAGYFYFNRPQAEGPTLGTGQRASFPYASPDQSYTWEIIVNMQYLGASQNFLPVPFVVQIGGNDPYIAYIKTSSGANPTFFANDFTDRYSTTVPSIGSWYIITLTHENNGNSILYVNGQQQATGSAGSNFASGASNGFELGNSSVFYARSQQYISKFKYYNRALSASEVSTNFNAQKSPYGL